MKRVGLLFGKVHRRLNGSVAEVLRKGGYSLDELLAQIRALILGREGTEKRST